MWPLPRATKSITTLSVVTDSSTMLAASMSLSMWMVRPMPRKAVLPK